MKQQSQPPQAIPSKKLVNCSNPKTMGNFYVSGVVSFVIFLYITAIYLAWMVKMPLNVGTVFFLLFVHISLFMFLWSFTQVIITDPGRVPPHWGFFLDDPDHKKRRYCLVCHIFKPERCHHCSVCNRCVLNMDHHCPWINNCVGFYNRKFFILMLFYVVLTSFIIFCGSIKMMYVIVEEIMVYCETGDAEVTWALDFFIFLGCCGDSVMFFVIVCFFKFHCTLVYSNMTTIEHLDNKRNTNPAPTTNVLQYDIGLKYNFYQIFGKNPWLWPFPMFGESGKPVGEGVVWPQINKENVNENLEKSSEMESMKKIVIGQEERRDERPKKLGHYENNPQFQTTQPIQNNIPYIEEQKRANIFGFSEKNYGFPEKNLGYSEKNYMPTTDPPNNFTNNTFLQSSFQNKPMLPDLNSPPKRLMAQNDNILIEERNSHQIYSDYKPNDSSFHSRNYDRGDNLPIGYNNNNNSSNVPYGLTGYSQPNPNNYKSYSSNKNENNFNNDSSNNEFLGLRNKSTLERYGYQRFDYGN